MLTNCFNICDYIQTNGTYNGIQIHRDFEVLPEWERRPWWGERFHFKHSYRTHHVMHSKQFYWKFVIPDNNIESTWFDIYEPNGPKVHDNYNNQTWINVFSGFISSPGTGLWKGSEISYRCDIYDSSNNVSETKLTTRCTMDSTYYSIMYVLDTNTLTNKDTTMFLPYFYAYAILNNPHAFDIPLFLTMLPDYLKAQLESIVEYDLGLTFRGHMLWFNINGRPMYCFTPLGKPLSKQCSLADNMKPFADYCFNAKNNIADQKTCQHFITNDTYSGVHMYRHWYRDYRRRVVFRYKLYTGMGREVDVVLERTDTTHRLIIKQMQTYHDSNNDIISEDTLCLGGKPIIISSHPDGLRQNELYIFIVDRNTGSITVLNVALNNEKSPQIKLINDRLCADSQSMYCKPPEFVNQLSAIGLLGQLESAIDYRLYDESGYMLWFNISGQPMYCFTPYGQCLSIQCSSGYNMILIRESNPYDRSSYICDIDELSTETAASHLLIKCEVYDGGQSHKLVPLREHNIKHPQLQFNAYGVIFSPTVITKPDSLPKDTFHSYLRVFDTNTLTSELIRVNYYIEEVWRMIYVAKPHFYIDLANDDNMWEWRPHQMPLFLTMLSNNLKAQLEGIVDYDLGPHNRGHMLWFNINGRPMYCFTPEGKRLSKQKGCTKTCQHIRSNDIYSGVQMYRHWYRDHRRRVVFTFRLSTGMGREMNVVLERTNTTHITAIITELIHSSDNTDIIFEGYFPNYENSTYIYYMYKCYAQYTSDIPLNPHPSVLRKRESYVFIVDKSTHTVTGLSVDVNDMTGGNAPRITRVDQIWCRNKRSIYCMRPAFVRQLSAAGLLTHLESAIDYQMYDESGFMLWFNISGQPMYCFTRYEQPLSPQCSSIDRMIPYVQKLQECTYKDIKKCDTFASSYYAMRSKHMYWKFAIDHAHNDTGIHIKLENNPTKHSYDSIYTDANYILNRRHIITSRAQFNGYGVIFSPIVSTRKHLEDHPDSYMHVLDTNTLMGQVIRIRFYRTGPWSYDWNGYVDICTDATMCDWHSYGTPLFLYMLSEDLKAQLEAIVDYDIRPDMRGHMLWFNINGRPMYCFTPEGERLSKQCSLADNMIPFANHCFKTLNIMADEKTCQHFKINDTYSGVHMYRHWYRDDRRRVVSTYKLYTGMGREMDFGLERTDTTHR
ncbi:unnamed protein product, partial [Medioppia subpectinata]